LILGADVVLIPKQVHHKKKTRSKKKWNRLVPRKVTNKYFPTNGRFFMVTYHGRKKQITLTNPKPFLGVENCDWSIPRMVVNF